MKNGSVFWAVMLILAGVLLLLGNLGLFDQLDINIWGLFWPLFLIVLGAWFIFGYFNRSAVAEVEEATIPLGDSAAAAIEIHHGAGTLTVTAGAAAGELAAGSFGGGLEQRSRRDGGRLNVKMRSPNRAGLVFPWGWASGALDWAVRLNRDVPLALEFELGASQSRIDLSDLRVTELKLETGASSTELILPAEAGQTRVDIEAGAARVTVRVPGGVAARIHTEAGLAHIDVDQTRFPEVRANHYESPDFATADNKADIKIETGLGSVSVG